MKVKVILNWDKTDIIAKRNVYALFRNKGKHKYDNNMQIMLMNINEVDCKKLTSLCVKRNEINLGHSQGWVK